VARIFGQLKLRIYRNGLRSGTGAIVRLVLSALAGLQLAGFGFIGLAALAALANRDHRTAIATCVFAVVTLGWVLGPLASTGYDNTLDLPNFVLLPLGRRQLMVGMLTSSFIGIGPLCALIALSGALIGLTDGVGSIVLAVPILGAYLVFNVVCTRALGVALTGLMRSRRGREVATAFVAVAAASSYLVLVFSSRISWSAIVSASAWLAWTPPGWAALALHHSAAGNYGAALALLVLLLAAAAIVAYGWSRALATALTAADSSTAAIAPTRREVRTPQLWQRFVTRPLGAVTAWNLRYNWRAPHRKIALFAGAIASIAAPLAIINSDPNPGVGWMLVTALSGWTMASQGANSFGYDGAARWQFAVTGFDVVTDLRGRNLAVLAVAGPVIGAAAVILALYTGGWPVLGTAVALGLSAFGVGTGLSNILSAWVPYPAPDNPRNPLAMGQVNSSGVLVLVTGVSMLAQVALMVPPIVIAVLSLSHTWLAWLTGPLSLIWGGGSYYLLTIVAGHRLRGREPELLAAVGAPG
jgi:ABC-2 type transport system permease protein